MKGNERLTIVLAFLLGLLLIGGGLLLAWNRITKEDAARMQCLQTYGTWVDGSCIPNPNVARNYVTPGSYVPAEEAPSY